MNLFDAIESQARERPEAPALLVPGRNLTFAGLVDEVRRLSATYAQRGLRPGEVVGTSLESSSRHLLVLLALIRLGAPFIVGHGRTPAARWRTLAEHFGMRTVISLRGDLGGAGVRVVSPLRAAAAAPAAAPPHPAGEGLWSISLTSGTTGTPRGVARTHAGFVRVAALQGRLLGIDPEARFLCRMAITTYAVLLRMLTHLCAGSAVVFTGDKLPGALEAIDRQRVTHSFISPFMLRLWLDALPRGHAPFAALRHLNVSGGALPEALCQEAERRLTPNLFVTYGATELGMATQADAQVRRAHPGTVGCLVPWIEAQAVDEQDRPLPAGEPGVLRFRGEGVATGYLGPGGQALQGGKGWFREGWCYPGDIGRVTAGRLLYIEGRVDDLINVGGPKVNVARIEKALSAHPAVAEVAVFGRSVDGKVEVIAAVVPRGAFDEKALLAHCRGQGVAPEGAMRVVQVRELPRNAMGKVLKLEVRSTVERLLRR